MTEDTAAEPDQKTAGTSQGFEDGVGDAPPLTADDLGIELPDGPRDAVEMLLSELARARDEVDERTADLQRVAAEFDNYRKRVARDEQQTKLHVIESVMRELLPVLDSYDAGLSIEPETEAEQRMLDGMRGTASQLMDALGRIGLEPIPAAGKPFDPAVHEAVTAPPGVTDLVVIQELRRGYTFRGRVLRAAMVALGDASDGGSAEESE